MHHVADRAELAEEHSDSFGAIVSDLILLVEHVHTSINLIEAAIARETSSGDQEANVIVLDDVTPQYMQASHALNACHASLGSALQFLLDAGISQPPPIPLTAH